MKALSDPTRLKPIDKKDGLLQVIIETPAGSRNKFAYDPDQGIFTLTLAKAGKSWKITSAAWTYTSPPG